MELHEREFLIGKICVGYFKHKLDGGLYIKVNPVTIDQYYESQEVFKDAYRQAKREGVLFGEEFTEFLQKSGVWTEEDQEELKDLNKEIEDCKVGIYNSYFRSEVKEQFKLELKEKTKQLYSLILKKHSYDYISARGVATFSRWNWIIENTTTYLDGTLYDWKHTRVKDVLEQFRGEVLEEDVIRELATTEPWSAIWSINGLSAIREQAFSQTENQKNLIAWTKVYESIQESTEYPPSDIVEDNDALDGWLIAQRRKRDSDRNKSLADGLTDKHEGADEVFIYAPSAKDAKKVDQLNDGSGRMVKEQRLSHLKSEGEVNYAGFKDIKMKVANQSADMQKGK